MFNEKIGWKKFRKYEYCKKKKYYEKSIMIKSTVKDNAVSNVTRKIPWEKWIKKYITMKTSTVKKKKKHETIRWQKITLEKIKKLIRKTLKKKSYKKAKKKS